jgi:hypothetical protein
VIVSGLLAPGMGMTRGLSDSSQASATRWGDTPWRAAASLTGSTPPAETAEPIPPSGDQGRKAMSRSVASCTSPLTSGPV